VSRSQLAINGGSPVREHLLPYGRQTITDADIEVVTKVLRSDFLTTGPEVTNFEENLAEVTGAPNVAAVSSGTAALHTMYASAGIGPGDEVILPAITFAATANAAAYLGAKPIFADVESDTLLIDPESVMKLVSPKTKAIVAVDFAGQIADYGSLRNIIGNRSIHLFADAAHSLGATRNNLPVGKHADAATFSFHPVKHVAAGEGGAIASANPELIERSKTFRNHGINADHTTRAAKGTWYYEMHELGFNYRLSDIHASLGSSQLTRLDSNLTRRNEIAAVYDEAFHTNDSITPLRTVQGSVNAFHIYVVQFELESLTVDRAEIFAAMRAENIGVNVHYIPVPWHPYYQNKGHQPGNWPAAENAYKRMMTLPIWPGMTNDDANDVIAAINKIVAAYRR
jgi:perosamine synthetase